MAILLAIATAIVDFNLSCRLNLKVQLKTVHLQKLFFVYIIWLILALAIVPLDSIKIDSSSNHFPPTNIKSSQVVTLNQGFSKRPTGHLPGGHKQKPFFSLH